MRGARPDTALERTFRARVPLAAGETIVAAMSGGPDSAALGTLLARAAGAAAAHVVFAHVNHALRASSWQDEAVVLALGVACGANVRALSLPPGPPSEERLRDERYAALAAIARERGAHRVFTAHHAGDQTETVLLALFRGSGVAGLGGMPAVRPLAEGIVLERPLLDVEPSELRAFCARAHVPYALDPSNADEAYRRNAVRGALDGLRAAYPHLDAAVARCARIVREDRAGVPRARLRERLQADILAVTGDARDVTFERLDAIAGALERGASGRHFVRRGVEIVIE